MIRIAMVEDNAADAELIASCVKRCAEEHDVPMTVRRFASGVDFISDYTPDYDVVLMDIEMPFLNGMETAQRLREKDRRVQLIFITNMAQYAVRGYDVDACGFIVKPIEYFSFSFQMRKAIERSRLSRNAYITLMGRDMAVKLYVQDICYVEVMRHKLLYHTTQGVVNVGGTLADAERELEPRHFARCNSCYLVNLQHVTQTRGNTVTVAGEELQISRSRKQEFMKRLASYFAGGGGGESA